MVFNTQAELLEYLGKDVNDRKLVQRMIARGEVVKEWRLYFIMDKDRKIKELEERLKEYDILVERVKKLSSENERLIREKNELIQQMIDKWEESSESEIIDKVYKFLRERFHMQESKTEFKEWLERN